MSNNNERLFGLMCCISFSTDIKNDVTRLDSCREELISELFVIVRNSAVIMIENNIVARRIFKNICGDNERWAG